MNNWNEIGYLKIKLPNCNKRNNLLQGKVIYY